MNKEEILKEFKLAKEELDKISVEYERLKKKCALLQSIIDSFENYENEFYYNFSNPRNLLISFLKSDSVTLGPKLYCRQKVFIAAFNDYCKENHLEIPRWTNFLYTYPFLYFGIKLLNNIRKKYPPNNPDSKMYNETFFMGVDVKNLPESDESDSD